MTAPARTSLATVLCAWLVVAIPLGWGLYQSVVKSLPLFTMGPQAAPYPGPAEPAQVTAPAPSAEAPR